MAKAASFTIGASSAVGRSAARTGLRSGGRFLVANDGTACGKWGRRLEQALGLKRGKVVLVELEDAMGASAVRTLAARIGFANGLALDEQHVSFAAARAGMPIVIVSPTLPIGPGDCYLTPPTRMILDFVNAASLAFVDFELNMIHVHDVALGQVRAAEHPGSVMSLLATPDASLTFFC